MNPGGDAAEQVVRLSLEGVEVAAKITGNGAKNIALLLYATLKQEQKTKGKARLTSMLKSGKELLFCFGKAVEKPSYLHAVLLYRSVHLPLLSF